MSDVIFSIVYQTLHFGVNFERISDFFLLGRYDRQWLHDGDPYSSSYPPGVGPQIVDHYTHSTPLPPINHNFNPRGEDYLNS